MIRRRTRGFMKYGGLLCALVVVPFMVAGCDGSLENAVGGSLRVVTSDWDGVARDPAFVCGDAVVYPLIAGQDEDNPIGFLTVSNDENTLYVEFTTTGGWVMETTHVHIESSSNPVPRAGNNAPIPGQFDYQHPNALGDAVTHDEYAIPFSALGIDDGDCGDLFIVWAHAEARLLDDGGMIIQKETAWAGDGNCLTDPRQPAQTRWCFFAKYEIQCCTGEPPNGDPGEFRTQTQGGWGTFCHGGNPGCYRNAWFDTAFPDGIVLGCTNGFTATFDTSEDVRDFLPSGGKPGPLTGNVVNPTSKTDAGVLLAQLLALELNLAFDLVDPDFGASDDWLGNQIVCNTGTDCDGLTIAELADEANLIIGGCTGTTGLGAGELADCLMLMNENYSDGDEDNGMACAP